VEFRSYRFTDDKGDNASIVETKQSRDLRKGTEIPLTETERMEFRETTKSTWGDGGHHPIATKV